MHYPAAHALINCGNWENTVDIVNMETESLRKEASFHTLPVPLTAMLPIFHFFHSLIDFFSVKYPSESYLWFVGDSLGTSFFFFFFFWFEDVIIFFTLFFLFKFLDLFWLHSVACETLVPQSGDQIHAPALQGYWTREVLFLTLE